MTFPQPSKMMKRATLTVALLVGSTAGVSWAQPADGLPTGGAVRTADVRSDDDGFSWSWLGLLGLAGLAGLLPKREVNVHDRTHATARV